MLVSYCGYDLETPLFFLDTSEQEKLYSFHVLSLSCNLLNVCEWRQARLTSQKKLGYLSQDPPFYQGQLLLEVTFLFQGVGSSDLERFSLVTKTLKENIYFEIIHSLFSNLFCSSWKQKTTNIFWAFADSINDCLQDDFFENLFSTIVNNKDSKCSSVRILQSLVFFAKVYWVTSKKMASL